MNKFEAYPFKPHGEIIPISENVTLYESEKGQYRMLAVNEDLQLELSIVPDIENRVYNPDGPQPEPIGLDCKYFPKGSEMIEVEHFSIDNEDLTNLKEGIRDADYWEEVIAKFGKKFAALTREKLDGDWVDLNKLVFETIYEEQGRT